MSTNAAIPPPLARAHADHVEHVHRSDRAAAAISVALAVLTVAAFWPVRRYGLINFDDTVYLTNPSIAKGLSAEGLGWAFTASFASNWHWHPLTSLTFLLERHFFGLNPRIFHTTNVVLHVANVVILFLLLRRTTGSTWRSAFVAALFAIHPLHVESVAWISERKDVLSTLFWLLTTWTYVSFVRRRGWRRYVLMMALFSLGLLAKPMLVTLPFALLLLDIWPLQRTSLREPRRAAADFKGLVWEKLPLFALALASSVVTFVVQSQGNVVRADAPLSLRLANAVHAYGVYLVKFVWPTRLAALYPFPDAPPPWVLPALLLLAATALVLWLAPRRPYLFTGWFWYVGTLVPVIGVIAVGPQSHADRYTYVPLMGIFIIFAWGAVDLFGRHAAARVSLGALALASTAACFVATRVQLTYWKDSETLIRRMLAVDPNIDMAHHYLGNVLSEEGRVDEAIEHYRRAVALTPRYVEAWHNLGRAYAASGKVDRAAEAFEMAAKLAPREPAPRVELAGIHLVQGDAVAALADMTAAMSFGADDAKAHATYARALAALGQGDRARGHFQRAVEHDPSHPDHEFYYGLFLHGVGEEPEAIQRYRRALALDPSSPARNNLAWILATSSRADLRDGAAAVRLMEAAEADRSRADALDTLAAAYAEAGRFPEAVTTARNAVELAERSKQPQLARDLRGRLALYERGQPYREGAAAPSPP